MQGEEVKYQGRLVSKDGFRVFVYGSNDQKKLVNSWDEFEGHMATGLWFAHIDDVPQLEEVDEEEDAPKEGQVLANLINPKPKGKRK